MSELEDRANHLDKMRTSTISSISYINDRNRKRNVEEAEKAILVNLYLLNKTKHIINTNYECFVTLGGTESQ